MFIVVVIAGVVVVWSGRVIVTIRCSQPSCELAQNVLSATVSHCVLRILREDGDAPCCCLW